MEQESIETLIRFQEENPGYWGDQASPDSQDWLGQAVQAFQEAGIAFVLIGGLALKFAPVCWGGLPMMAL